ncbi:hypothetical protein Q0Z83_023320 [Actinoplanes sichuanensis]|uniref:Secreted protein n=1 Tax=Actinoplanes sichuanensis TaxID=512349 RepID=A0ABW4A0K7_9ACTN|nr:hypothetical protein [Actinoplanes sichuanensis]BEL04141.1 hypothetical protein Q0Z83_023320 [Actinoplanes sichuanensis]
MFVFGDDGPRRRLGLPGVLVLLLVAAGVLAAVWWDPTPPSPAAVPIPAPRGDISTAESREEDERFRSSQGCDVGILIHIAGDVPAGPEQVLRLERQSRADTCTDAIADDPRRVRLSPPDGWDSQAVEIHAAMDRVLCPPTTECRHHEPNKQPKLTDADLAAVRQALIDIGRPEAEVRPVQYGDGGPGRTVMYGIPLGHDACAVSYATIGLHPGRLGAVGVLTSGRCLRPAEEKPD